MSTPQQAAVELRQAANAVLNNVNEAKQAAATDALRALIDGTPVLTGRARRSWTVGIGKRPRRAKRGANPEAAFATIKQAKPGEVIYIVNRVPYINRLNRGWSKKRPAGFYERAVQIARAAILRFN
jgi:hypothetical protein